MSWIPNSKPLIAATWVCLRAWYAPIFGMFWLRDDTTPGCECRYLNWQTPFHSLPTFQVRKPVGRCAWILSTCFGSRDEYIIVISRLLEANMSNSTAHFSLCLHWLVNEPGPNALSSSISPHGQILESLWVMSDELGTQDTIASSGGWAPGPLTEIWYQERRSDILNSVDLEFISPYMTRVLEVRERSFCCGTDRMMDGSSENDCRAYRTTL